VLSVIFEPSLAAGYHIAVNAQRDSELERPSCRLKEVDCQELRLAIFGYSVEEFIIDSVDSVLLLHNICDSEHAECVSSLVIRYVLKLPFLLEWDFQVLYLFTGRKRVKTFGMMKYLSEHIKSPSAGNH
jgi:hypothetical protein